MTDDVDAAASIRRALLGQKIVGYRLTSDGKALTLSCETGENIVLIAVGDCCSHTWIESLDTPNALLGTVLAVVARDMPNLGDVDGTRHKGVDRVCYYGLKITTSRGDCVIDFRNDSSGHYGGWLEVAK